MASDGDEPTVLVADDDVDFTETVAFWLRDEYDVRTACSGDDVLDQHDESVDVVLLDRWFSEWDGDDLLTAIREQAGQCHVAIVTAAEPDLDLLNLSFEEYVMKPVSKEELSTTVDRLLDLRDEDEQVREYYALRTTLGVLESPRRAPHVDDGHQLDELRDRVRRKRTQLESGPSDDLDQQYNSLKHAGPSTIQGETTD